MHFIFQINVLRPVPKILSGTKKILKSSETRLSTELPGEVFTGFSEMGALFDDFEVDVDDFGDEHRKVSREVRNACHCQVSIDLAPRAELVALSQTGATLTGIPRGAVWTRHGNQGRRSLTPEDFTSKSEMAWSKAQQEELVQYLTGASLPRGSRPLGCCYGGHQFGQWAGQLGDGRVATLGELKGADNCDEVADIASTWCGRKIEVRAA